MFPNDCCSKQEQCRCDFYKSQRTADMAHPEEIEAAAQALFDRHVARCFARGLQPHHRKGTQVKDMPPSYRDDYLADAAAALAAAEAIRQQQSPNCGGWITLRWSKRDAYP